MRPNTSSLIVNKQSPKTEIFILVLLAYLTWLIAAFCGTGDDTYWHIKVGEWILDNHRIPTTGIFSYTAANMPWVSHEWLSAIILYAVFSVAGWPGLVLLATLAITLAMWSMCNFLVKRISINSCIIFVLFAYFLLTPHIMPRPHILILPIMVFWTAELIKASENQTHPPYPLALVMVFWSNMHGSFILGIPFILYFAAESAFAIKDSALRLKELRRWLLFFLLSLSALLANPHGIDGLLLPFKLTDQTYVIDHIVEWASPNFHGFQPLEFWLLGFIGFTLCKGLTLPPFRLIFLLGLLHLSLKYIRFATDLLPFLSPLILATPLSKQLNRPADFSIDSLYPKNIKHWLAIGLYLTALSFYLPARTIETKANIHLGKLLAALQDEKPVLGNMLNSYSLSPYLIYYDYPVFIDSRGELYGDPFIEKHFKTTSLEKGAEPLLDLIKEYNVSWTIFETNLPINAFLSQRPEWRRIYSDKFFTIYLTQSKDINERTKRELQKIKDNQPKDDAANNLPL
ncbi:hypothetical protein [Methylomicrobium lacus]|uniref:hypothetical protein n=1 Tax=Methylomicrobium lacus TaxID=136992 RepID=UPI0035A90DCE